MVNRVILHLSILLVTVLTVSSQNKLYYTFDESGMLLKESATIAQIIIDVAGIDFVEDYIENDYSQCILACVINKNAVVDSIIMIQRNEQKVDFSKYSSQINNKFKEQKEFYRSILEFRDVITKDNTELIVNQLKFPLIKPYCFPYLLIIGYNTYEKEQVAIGKTPKKIDFLKLQIAKYLNTKLKTIEDYGFIISE